MGRGQTIIKDVFSHVIGERRGRFIDDEGEFDDAAKDLSPGEIYNGVLGFLVESVAGRPRNSQGHILRGKEELENLIWVEHPDWSLRLISEALKSMIRNGVIVSDRVGILYYRPEKATFLKT